jgi:transcriptional regulator with XRE-family HTH domain
MEADLKAIGSRLQEIRKRLNLLQKKFAQELGISASSLCDMEAGNMKPRFELIYSLTKKFNVNVLYLLHGQGDMFMPEDKDIFRESGALNRHREWFRDFLYYFEHSPMARYSLMSMFITYLHENEKLIQIDIKKHQEKGEQQ